jgi:hypothetical protein
MVGPQQIAMAGGRLSAVYLAESGFMARGTRPPQRDDPRNWYVWHFTHVDNLEGIARAGALRPAHVQDPLVNVAYDSAKRLRSRILVRPPGHYPAGHMVDEHVPFYIAAKSPMLFVVTRGHDRYQGGDGPLVFLGATIGDIADHGLTWCVSDRSAASPVVAFTCDETAVGDFVDFDLLCQRMWNNTPSDPDRMTRRGAELLVLGDVPLSCITTVITKSDEVLRRARAMLDTVVGDGQYHELRGMFF